MNTILFDLDGTLIDSTEAILTSFYDSFRYFDEQIPPDKEILALIGHPLDFMFEHLGVQKNRVDEHVKVYKKFYRGRSKEMTNWLPQAKDAILKASKFAKLGVVTTKTGRYSKELLEYMGVLSFFDVLIGREDVIYPKPHPEPILKALHQMKVAKESSWMIGDTCLDIVSANRAEIKSIAVLSGYGTKNDLKKCSNEIKKCAFEAVEFIERLI